MCRDNLGETLMSEQDKDFNSFQEHLERIFKDIEYVIWIANRLRSYHAKYFYTIHHSWRSIGIDRNL